MRRSSGISVMLTCYHMAGIVRIRSKQKHHVLWTVWGPVCHWFLFDLLCKWQDYRVSRLDFISLCLARVSSHRSIGRILMAVPSPRERTRQALLWFIAEASGKVHCRMGRAAESRGTSDFFPLENNVLSFILPACLCYWQTRARNRKYHDCLNWSTGFNTV